MHKLIEVVAAIIEQDGKVLIAKRPGHKHQGGKWEFPGGKIEPNESALEALKREIQEEIDLKVIDAEIFETLEHHYQDKSVRLIFFRVTQFAGSPNGNEGQPIRWVPVSDLPEYTFPEANHMVVKRLLNES